MNKLLKWVLAGVGIFVVLLVVITVVLPKVIDPNNYKEKIRTAVFEETGRELTIGGEIEWSVFPSIGLELSDLSLSNRVGFGDQPMLKIGEARVSVKLMPIFSKQVKVGQVNLKGVSAYLRQNVDGHNNWEDLTGPHANTEDTQSSDGGDALTESEIEISGGAVTLYNTNRSIDIEKFGGNISGIELGQPFEVEGVLSVNLVQEKLVGEVKFSSLVQPATNAKWIGIEDIDVSFKGKQGAAEESTPLEMTATANAELDLASDRASLRDFVFQFFDVKVNGDLNVTSLANDPAYTGEFKLAEFSPKALMKDMGMELPQTEDETALTKMWGDMRVAGSPGSFKVQNLRLKLDKSTFNGGFSIEGSENPRLAFDFVIDRLNLDDYSFVTEENAGVDGGAEANDPIQAFGIFFILPGGGDLRIGELVASGLTVTDINVKTNSNIDSIRLFPISAKLYGGEQQGDIKIDISGNRPILTANQVLTGVQVENLLNDLTGDDRLRGTGDFYMKIRTDLSNSDTTIQALSGDIGLNVSDGAIIGIDVAETISVVKSTLGQKTESSAATEQDKKTEFSEFNVTGIFDKGILKSDDLMMRSPLFTATGKGSVNLVSETVNYVLKPVVVDSTGIEGLDQLSGVPIPVKITGNMYEPDFSVDVVAGLTGSQKAKLDEKKDELTSSLLDQVFGSKKDKKKKKKDSSKEDGGMY